MKYRKKPVVVDAVLWDETHEALNQLGDLTEDAYGWVDANFQLHIETWEGIMHASKGDWIIRGIQGEFYPCKPDIFEATYERVDE